MVWKELFGELRAGSNSCPRCFFPANLVRKSETIEREPYFSALRLRQSFAAEALKILRASQDGVLAQVWHRFYSLVFGAGEMKRKRRHLVDIQPRVLKLEKDLEVRVANPIPKDVGLKRRGNGVQMKNMSTGGSNKKVLKLPIPIPGMQEK